jgi:hypothetical protein
MLVFVTASLNCRVVSSCCWNISSLQKSSDEFAPIYAACRTPLFMAPHRVDSVTMPKYVNMGVTPQWPA